MDAAVPLTTPLPYCRTRRRYDKALCEAGNCSAPIFTFDKRWHAANGSSPHDDILHPVMNHPFEELISYPWDKKIEVRSCRRACCQGPNGRRN